jgi:hypothetical protein
MIMYHLIFTLFTEVKVLANTTFIANTNYWEAITTVTSHSTVDRFSFLYWFFSLKLRILLWFLFNDDGFTDFMNDFGNHLLDSFFDEFHASFFEVFLLLLPFFMTFFSSFLEVYHYWVSIRINGDYDFSIVIFK